MIRKYFLKQKTTVIFISNIGFFIVYGKRGNKNRILHYSLANAKIPKKLSKSIVA